MQQTSSVDRELLELAAKFDYAALQLARMLRLRIAVSDERRLTEVVWFAEFGKSRSSGAVTEMWGRDRDAATRRAIVNAADKIGKSMP